jgi:hypothetical protein
MASLVWQLIRAVPFCADVPLVNQEKIQGKIALVRALELEMKTCDCLHMIPKRRLLTHGGPGLAGSARFHGRQSMFVCGQSTQVKKNCSVRRCVFPSPTWFHGFVIA